MKKDSNILTTDEFNTINNYISKHKYEYKTLFDAFPDGLKYQLVDDNIILDPDQYKKYIEVKKYIEMEANRKNTIRSIRIESQRYREPFSTRIHEDS